MAYVTRFIYGTDKLRTNAFEVRGLNGVSSGIIHCDLAVLSQWLKLITDNIVGLTQLQVAFLSFYKIMNSHQNYELNYIFRPKVNQIIYLFLYCKSDFDKINIFSMNKNITLICHKL